MRRSVRRVARTAARPARAASASAPAAGTRAWPVTAVTLAGSGLGAAVSTWAQPCRVASSARPAPAAPSSSSSASSRRGWLRGRTRGIARGHLRLLPLPRGPGSASWLVAASIGRPPPRRPAATAGRGGCELIPRREPVAYDRTMGYARDERLALSALLDQAGPREPTLCEGWTTLDLAAHLVLREHRPDAGLGLLGGPLAAHTRSVQRRLAGRTPYPRLVQMIRNGPPRLSLFGLPGADERANAGGVLRAPRGRAPRPAGLGAAQDRPGPDRDALAAAGDGQVRPAEGAGRRRARPGRPARAGPAGGPRVRITAKARTPVVTVTGPPAELTMWTFGRTAAARVRLDGSEEAVAALSRARWGL